ncbi:hypothetical protein CCR95_23335 [Thiocystis minor]|uniref:PGPGW domain-containing protein n=1 Tax=Thiocystis minor TaxID=61597 RepID=UPI001912ABD5|nr:PGPGW domain-containing protein [Thiocystis minor]MBK5966922.1 hypothetical protein [Thiocystis minor]
MLDGLLIWIESHPALIIGVAGLSVATFAGSLLALPFLVSRLPVDYFSDPRRHRNRLGQDRPLVYFILRGFKNVLGWALILSGILMLVLPGQGLLTIIIGLILSDFPGKFTLERRLASRPRILGAINWLRRLRGHHPLLAPCQDE